MSSPDGSPPEPGQVLDWVLTWVRSLGEVLSQIAGTPFAVESTQNGPPDSLPPMATDVHAIATAAGSLRGEMSWRLPQTAVAMLAQLFLSETQDPNAELKPDYREAVEELLRQVAGHAATAMKPRWGEVQLHIATGAAPSWPPGETGWIVSGASAPIQFWLEWQVSAALGAALRAAEAPSTRPGNAAPPASASEPAAAALEGAGKLDLLMDVELDVTLRFGGRNMRLSEILELGPGSVIELDRNVEEPADLLLDGKLIARGEVVVVDGNYGLRVLEVIAAPPLAPH